MSDRRDQTQASTAKTVDDQLHAARARQDDINADQKAVAVEVRRLVRVLYNEHRWTAVEIAVTLGVTTSRVHALLNS